METELIREYASRMEGIFADKAKKALLRCEASDYLSYLEDRRDFWAGVAQLPPDSDTWELVKRYMSLMSAPSTSKMPMRSLYNSLREKICKAQKEDVKELSWVCQHRKQKTVRESDDYSTIAPNW